MFTGLEVDVLSLGDADCIVVTHPSSICPHRSEPLSGLETELVLPYAEAWAAVFAG
jgi:hypothetical protein